MHYGEVMAPDRGTILLKDLKFKLQRLHVGRLRRSLQFPDIEFEEGQGGEFTVIVTPKHLRHDRLSEAVQLTTLFAGTFHLSPHAWAVEKRACDYTADIIREVLEQRGIA